MPPDAFDPARLVALARAQHPGRPALAEALARCTAGTGEGRAYVRFADPDAPAWDVAETVRLAERGGDVMVDVLRDGRIGGVEYLGRL